MILELRGERRRLRAGILEDGLGLGRLVLGEVQLFCNELKPSTGTLTRRGIGVAPCTPPRRRLRDQQSGAERGRANQCHPSAS